MLSGIGSSQTGSAIPRGESYARENKSPVRQVAQVQLAGTRSPPRLAFANWVGRAELVSAAERGPDVVCLRRERCGLCGADLLLVGLGFGFHFAVEVAQSRASRGRV